MSRIGQRSSSTVSSRIGARQRVFVGGLGVLLTLSATGIAHPSPAPSSRGSLTADSPSGNERVVRYDHEGEPLRDVSQVDIQGRRTADYPVRCEFETPVLRLDGPGTIEARPRSVDYSDCSAIWEVGVPLADSGEHLVENSVLPAALEPGDAGRGLEVDQKPLLLAASSSKSASGKVIWHDIVHLTTTRLQSNISWTYNGSQITSSTGSWNYYKLTATGWQGPFNTSSYIGRPSNTMHYVRTSGTFVNPGVFCSQITVTTYVVNVRVLAYANGSADATVDNTWTTEEPSWLAWGCPNLHYHVQLSSPA